MASLKEGPHPAAFILSEANGQLSRENRNIPASQDFPPNTVLTAGGVPAAAGAASPLYIAIYGVKTEAGETAKVAVIAREAEVNRHTIAWPAAFTDANIDTMATELAKQMIIVRGAPLPSP